MKKVLALLAAVGAVVFFWRKKKGDEDTWDTATDTASGWAEAAEDKAEETAEAAADAVDEAKP